MWKINIFTNQTREIVWAGFGRFRHSVLYREGCINLKPLKLIPMNGGRAQTSGSVAGTLCAILCASGTRQRNTPTLHLISACFSHSNNGSSCSEVHYERGRISFDDYEDWTYADCVWRVCFPAKPLSPTPRGSESNAESIFVRKSPQ